MHESQSLGDPRQGEVPNSPRLCPSLAIALVVASLCSVGHVDGRAGERAKRPPSMATEAPRPQPLEDPPSDEGINAAVKRGVDFLVGAQLPTGAWGSARRTKDLNILTPVPGGHHAFQTATTAICVSALLELDSDDPQTLAALDKAEEWLLWRLPTLRRANTSVMYNCWSHAYALQALARMLDRHADDKEHCKEIRRQIHHQIDSLVRYECVNGGWCYLDFDYNTRRTGGSAMCFVTAAGLVGLRDVRERGIEGIPEPVLQRAIASIERQRLPDYCYLYGEYLKDNPTRGINRPMGSLGRSQACNIAMRYWGDETITDEVVMAWLDRLFARNGWLSMGRKRPVPHESWAQVAGYFYYFGHYYAALCIDALPEEKRAFYQQYMAHTLLPLQEKDGSWWDYPLYDYHQPYGTGFALATLLRCRSEWDESKAEANADAPRQPDSPPGQ